MRVTFDYPPYYWDPQGRVLGDYLVDLLDRLGYHGRVRPLPVNAFYARGYEFQLALDAWGADYPAASNFITNRFTCDATYIPSAGFCDRKIDAMIERATKMQASDPTAAGALWARIDHSFVDQAPYVWLENPVAVEFISQRVGNYRWSLQWGSLLDQLWVR